MEKSLNFGFNLPSRDSEDIADINKITENFRILDESATKKEDFEKLQGDVEKIDLKNLVTNTDYATETVGGVVKVGGIGIGITPDGTLCTDYANPNDIDKKTDMAKPIVPYFLDYAVRSVGDVCYASIDAIGDIEAAVDAILAIQEELIGGGA